MATFFATICTVSILVFVMCLLLMVFRRARPKAKRGAKWSAGAAVAAVVAVAVFGSQEDNKKAVAAGWTNATDMREAQKAGVTDPAVWLARKEEIRLQAEADAKALAETRAQIAAAEKARADKFATLTTHPFDQAAFVSAIVDSRNAYRSAANDFQKGAMRPARAAQICKVLDGRSVSNWIGKVTTLTTNSDGKGVLGLQLANDIYVETMNNALSDISAESMIEPGSKMYAKMAAIQSGDMVKFAGSFLPSRTDCVEEHSVTLDGSLREPEFTFRFRDVAKIAME